VIGARWFVSGRGEHRCRPSGIRISGWGRPNDPRQVRRWHAWRSVPMTARDAPSWSPRFTGRASGVTCTRLLGRFRLSLNTIQDLF